ncbi:MAG: T9SS type B sorting domain-containing protein [Bacteroidota bacterium]
MYTYKLRKTLSFKSVFCLFLLLATSQFAQAQLSDLHYLPPLKQGQNNAGIQSQAIYLSTPEPTTFTVNVYRGTNATPWRTYNINNTSPAVIDAGEGLTNGDNNITLVNNANTGIILTNSGLRFESPSGNRFYVNYRGNSSAQAASLTAKGRQALGTAFKWGGVPNLGGRHPSKSNTLGIMATEDNTTVTLFGYDPDCTFRIGNDANAITANTYTITLNANESFVFENYVGNVNPPSLAQQQGWLGASIEADKDIVISNGSINFGRQVGQANRDAGIDQPVPENRLGKDYVFVRGNGNTSGITEFPLLIAIEDNTQVFVNGSPAPLATLNTGDYFEVPSSYFSSNAVGANMFVQTSKNVYAYQCMAGASQVYTQGLNFVAPVNCLLPDVMDNIPDIRNMAGTTVTGGMTIIAAVNTPDANIIVTDGNGPVTLPASNPVAGTADWKTFYIPNLNGDVSVQSTGPMAVGFFGFNSARGVAGYFSGFDTVPEVILEIRGGTGCFVGSEIFEATESFDAYQWYRDGQLIPGANGANYAPTVAGDYYVRGTKGPCTYDSNTIQALYCDPDIVLDKTVDNNEIMEGETAIFTIRVRNNGVGPVTNLQITDNIPAGLTLENAFTIHGSWSGNTWNIGTLDGGDVAELELTVRADEIDILPLLSLINTVTNTQDQTDVNTTPDNPTALITVHNDSDNDGVRDITDLDDDNDGIYDEDECDTLGFNIANGASHNSALVSVDNYLVMDVFSIDNSFNLNINGNDVAGEVQFQIGAAGNFARFIDGTTYGEGGNPDIWTVTGTNGTPILRVVIDQAGQFQIFGTRSTNGPLEPMVLDTPPTAISWNPAGSNTITIGQAVVGPTNMQGVLLTAGCDTDSDGLPDHLDLDSDGDGCSDANEYYKDNNADGGDGGEYGTGMPPAVDPADGTVNAASYVQVFAPEIVLGNTSEDLGGADINGQAISLGESFQYVIRFQNTGDDDATNFTIRNILPDNVTLDGIDTTDAPFVTNTPLDPTTNEIVFTVPDDLVEVGDPVYTIRILVTLSANCSEFVNACSDTLINEAYATFQGVTNPTVFTDEPGSANFPCTTIPAVANNSVSGDLANCSEARTVQLCGDDAILTAGAGFTTYTWALDTNGNGQIDPTETPINDGDSDGDPSTLLITDIGNYIVEKSGATGCADMVELITVERFGTTQTNPVIEFFNQVNSDSNPNNDLQGEIVTCSIDGDLLPKIFLCGENDEALIQLGITDADSIVWQQLDEASCTDTGDDCANKNGTCSWTDLAVQDNYTITDSGEYRVVINYLNGCFSRFYFNVFKNTLDLDYTREDILCNTPGNIRMTNIGSGYGFQLVDASNDNIVVPFSADNGPSFDITTSGSYYVQVTQLNPVTGDPIAGACIFETEDIGILERDYQVNINPIAAECGVLGSIEIQALNVLPNYSYELRLDDGTNGGAGSFVDSNVASSDNTYTFVDVNPGDYIVITTTDDGCTDTQNINVTEVTELTLTAVTTDNITCNPGVITLTPDGGNPNPDYQMAVWNIDGADQYANPPNILDIPPAELQTATNFTFADASNAATYIFIVFDDSGCYAFSNPVTLDYLGTPSISASNTDIICADSATSTLTVTVSGGTAPYQYSLDGTNFQATNTFVNLPAGFYTITVMDSSGTPTSRCVETLDYEIVQPFRLTASAAIVEDASCNSSGALVKILNASGGQAPYEYSFDGGSSFGTLNERNLMPGSYQLVVRDNLECTYDMDLTVPAPVADPNLSFAVDYDCAGLGIITISTSNTVDFDYTYTVPPTWTVNNNVFSDVPDGLHTVTVEYSSTTTPDQTTLFFENFGAGPDTQIGEIGPDYCYEPQDGSLTPCNRGPAGILVNGEYTVTNFVTNPVSFFTSPQDHTGLVDGRFLAIDVSTFSDTGSPILNTVLWTREDVEVLPNEDITLNFWAYNLMNLGGAGNNPEVLIEILDNTGTIIHSMVASDATGTFTEIPKNTSDTDWHERTITFNPGANTEIDIVFRNNVNSNDGNDLILDDITAFQVPEVCPASQDLEIPVLASQGFDAQLLAATDPSCFGSSDGFVQFEVSNFTTGVGFEYSFDNSTWITPITSSPITTAANLGDGSYTIYIRKVDDTSCTTSFPVTLTSPTEIIPGLTQTSQYTCFNAGATLEASATDGTPAYEYQLETTGGTIVAPFQTNPIFTGVTDGDYLVRVLDDNGCEVLLPNAQAVTVAPPQNVAFTTSYTNCYDGLNNATITVTVTSGNGDYTFSINGGAASSPSPTTPNEYTFTNLSNGTYTIEVVDNFGCSDSNALNPIVIDQTLTAQINIDNVTSCADGTITVTPSGGDGNYVYAFLPNGTSVSDSDFGPSNTFTVTTASAGDFDIYVRDNNGLTTPDPYCQNMWTRTVASAPVLTFVPTPSDPNCHDGPGSIDIGIVSGDAPFTIEIIDLDNAGASDETVTNVLANNYSFFNLLPGDYTINITDSHGCTIPNTPITINNPDELIADLQTNLPGGCAVATGFSFINYPTTLAGTLEFSADGGTSWQASDTFNTYTSGDVVEPSIRTVDGSGNVLCRLDLPEYALTYPLDSLLIDVYAVVNCNELQVTVQGNGGTSVYEYTYTHDPNSFDPVTAIWIPASSGTPDGSHTFTNLPPGRTYVFYVRDSGGCLRQSDVDINTLVTNPVQVDGTATPACFGGTGGLDFTITPQTPSTHMDWELFEVGNAIPVQTSGTIPFSSTVSFTGITPGYYYLQVTQSGGATCEGASLNTQIEVLDAISGNPSVLQDIACDRPGLIEIPDIQGGGGTYYYTVTGPSPFVTIAGTLDNPIEIPANSPAGTYTISVVDQYGCTSVPTPLGDVHLNLAADPVIDSTVVDNCSTEAGITVTSPSAGPLFYSIDNGAGYSDSNSTGVFTNVPTGTYTVTILNGGGCSDTDTITVHPNIQASATLVQNLGCGVGNEAQIEVDVTAGSGTYEYEILDGSSNIVVTRQALAPPLTEAITVDDTYTVNIYDVGVDGPECARSFPVVVAPSVTPAIVVDSFSDATCNTANDGNITVTASNLVTGTHTIEIVSGTGAVISTFPIAAPNGGTTVTFENLEATVAGIDYTIRVTSPNGCFAETTRSITEPEPIIVDPLVRVEYTCSSGDTPSNASVSFNSAVGGSGNFVRYAFFRDGNPVPVQDGTNPTWIETDFAGGSYTLTVYDDNGCSGSSAPIIVAPYDQLQPTAVSNVINGISCTSPTEDIEIINVQSTTTNFGSDPLNYQFRMLPSTVHNAPGDNQFTGLGIGTHTFGVLNVATGCEIFVEHTVANPNTFDIVVNNITDVVCFGDDGSIDVTITDATYVGDYDWEVLNDDTSPTTRLDDHGTLTGSGTILNIPVAAGNYIIRVTQVAFPECFQEWSFTITTPSAPIDLTPIALTDVGCTNDQGSALVAPTGGEAPYTIELTPTSTGIPVPVPNVNAHLFESLSAGQYTVRVTDARGCIAVFTNHFDLVLPDPISGTISNTTLVCQGDTDASVSLALNPRNVITNYRFVLNTYNDAAGTTLLSTSTSQTTPGFNNLGAGFYSISVLDDMACEFESAIVEVIDPSDVEALLVTNQPLSCQLGAELLLVASGGTGPYQWSTDGTTFNPMNETFAADTHLFTNVPVDDYQYYIMDSDNCVSTISNRIDVEAVTPLTVDIDPSAAAINCNGESTALIEATADGGLGNYQYALFRDMAATDEVRPNQPDGTFADLPMGTYYVRVQSEDCETISGVIQIDEPTPLMVVPDITEISCSDTTDGAITLDVQGGTGDYQFAISPNLDQFDDENSFDELAPGAYTVIVQDGNGCFEVVEFELIAPDPLALNSITITDEICFESADGTVTIEVVGGTAPYFTSLNSNADADFEQDVFQYADLASGTHVLFIRDANGCEATEVFEVNSGVNLAGEAIVEYICDGGITTNRVSVAFEDPTVSADVLYGLDTNDPAEMVIDGIFEGLVGGDHFITVLHSNGCAATYDFNITEFEPLGLQLTESNINTISALATGGSGNYTFAINDRSATNDSIFYITETATYTITVTDENGCSVSAEIFVEFIDIEIPNFFTPDGDGNNDTWAPRNIEQYDNIFIKIYDRYGRTLYQFKGNEDDWDGQYNLNDLPTGDYWYIIKLNGIEDEREFIGHFTLYR